MKDYRIIDPRFGKLIIGHAKLEHLWTGGRWVEGPVHVPAGRYVLFSDIPNDRIMRFDETSGNVSVFREPARNANGNTLDHQGRLVTCEHQSRSVTRTEHDGHISTIANHFGGKRLNSPNDVVVASDDSVWFTDPTYGIDSDYEGDVASEEIGASNVYRCDPATGEISALVTALMRPNGLCFSPNEQTLYVSDTGATHDADRPKAIHSFRLDAARSTLLDHRMFAISDAGFFDGFRCDMHGNVWTSTAEGVRCYAPDGSHIGTVVVPEIVSNLCFGGRKRNRLYITAQTSLYAIYLNTGAPRIRAR
ncbi:MAG TPA: SMP-30/gluconolactonase/LRE family protein [Hyphomicrobiaceae bacterium]|nr:SMP-30/gluconolactonase/LRE family protein [Hyphomicrobiaceae bacterium]